VDISCLLYLILDLLIPSFSARYHLATSLLTKDVYASVSNSVSAVKYDRASQ